MQKLAKKQEQEFSGRYRVETRWVLAGLSVTMLLAIADVAKTWYWFPDVIPVPVPIYALAIAFVYVSWVGIGIFIGWFRRKVALDKATGMAGWFIHGGVSIAIGSAHLLANTALVWLMFKPTRPQLMVAPVYAEKLVAWLPYEVLAYWACLAVFRVVELQGEKRREGSRELQAYKQDFAVKRGSDVRLVSCSVVDWIEACDNYVLLNTATEQHTLYDTMARLESSLDPNQFQRIHRSTIVNMNSIDSLQSDESGGLTVLLKGQQVFPVSRRRRARVRRVLATRRTLH